MLPALWWGLPSLLQLLLRVLPGPDIVVVARGPGLPALSIDADARYALTETALATIWVRTNALGWVICPGLDRDKDPRDFIQVPETVYKLLTPGHIVFRLRLPLILLHGLSHVAMVRQVSALSANPPPEHATTSRSHFTEPLYEASSRNPFTQPLHETTC